MDALLRADRGLSGVSGLVSTIAPAVIRLLKHLRRPGVKRASHPRLTNSTVQSSSKQMAPRGVFASVADAAFDNPEDPAMAREMIDAKNVLHPGKTYRMEADKFRKACAGLMSVLPRTSPGMT